MPRLTLLLASEIPLYAGNMQGDLQRVSRARFAEQITGGLSITTKMPCPSWGISATRCRIGSALAQTGGSVCAECYALKGRYVFPAVQAKLEERYRGLFHTLWTPAMVFLIHYYADRYFRWFDSGDLQGENHLRNICTVAAHTPDVQHWLPTREYETARACRSAIPPNLTVRLSAHLIDGKPPRWPTTSIVVSGAIPEATEACPAPDQDGRCGNCRACWRRDISTVAYRLH